MPRSPQNKDEGRDKPQGKKSRHPAPDTRHVLITPAVLRAWPLPQPDESSDKDERGKVLVVGGAPEMPGAIILAATAALRAGAGKLCVCAGRSIAQLVAAAVPEARVVSLPETKEGGIAASAASKVVENAEGAQAILIGPGMIDERAITRLIKSILPRIERATLILDAGALAFLSTHPDGLHTLKGRVVVTPHAGEMASMRGIDKLEVTSEPGRRAREAAHDLRAVVALKGGETFIAAPDDKNYSNRAGNVGLATSGSGDTLSGIIAGLAARGAEPLQAAIWGVYLHACAGDRLAKRMGRLGFLARELLAEIPQLMSGLDGRKKRS
ncbi:MAG: NAD(P)H-hydrate dehydratase [Pyrinomonadaceae bacterium]